MGAGPNLWIQVSNQVTRLQLVALQNSNLPDKIAFLINYLITIKVKDLEWINKFIYLIT